MTQKTTTIVVIESHQQTIVRRSRRTVSSELLTQGASSDETERPAKRGRRWLGTWWRKVIKKSATVLAPLSHRLKTRANERTNRLS